MLAITNNHVKLFAPGVQQFGSETQKEDTELMTVML